MKKLIILSSVVLLLAVSSCKSDHKITAADVPQPVMEAFNTKYPDATGTEWITEKSDGKMVYEASFKSAGKDIEAEFYDNGTFKQED